MRVAWFLLLAALATGCGSAEPGAERPGRYGISLDGEGGEVSRGLIRIARGDLSVVLYEHEPAPTEDGFFNDPWPVRLNAIDLRSRDGSPEAVRATSTAGRSFSVGVEAASPAAASQIEQLNNALAAIRVEAGDHFPGEVEPPRFPPRSGWITGTGRPEERAPDGEYAGSWAATVPFRDDDENHWPPHRTLKTIPPDGIVIQVTLSRSPMLWEQNALRAAPPYRIHEFVRRDCPGKACEVPEHLLVAAYGDRYRVEIRAYFGRAQPTGAMLADADVMLDGLRFPDWGPWELEPS